jgi:hypothetical protein
VEVLVGVLVDVLVLFLILAALVLLLVVRGYDRRPVGVAEVTGTPVWAQLPPGEGVLVRGRDVEGGVAPQVHRQEGTPPAYLPRSSPSHGIGRTGTRRVLRCHHPSKFTSGQGTGSPLA